MEVIKMHDTYSNCPYCGEEIKKGAIKCKHCKSMIGEGLGVDKNNSYDQREAKKNLQVPSPHLLLLSKFLNGNSPKSFYGVEYWKTALGEKPDKIIKNFIREGLLDTAGLSEKINYKYKASDLKKILKERELKVSGHKEELIQRLIDNDIKVMTEATKDIDLYQCTSTGKQLAENYLTDEKDKRESVEREVLKLLSQKDYPNAAQIVAKYEASQVFPRGMGIDWKNYDGASDVESLEMIFNLKPSILQGIDENRLEQIRIAAAMMKLWGTNKARQWLPDDFDTGISLDKYTACFMLIHHARHLNFIRGYKEAKEMGLNIKIEIVGTHDSCFECKKIQSKIYNLEDLPEIPYPECKHESGCRCVAAGKFQ
jgi:hypothetical protein